jgi:hypothetical protein
MYRDQEQRDFAHQLRIDTTLNASSASRRAELLFHPADGLVGFEAAVGRRATGQESGDLFLRRDNRAVRPPAEEVADLAQRRSRVFAGKIHRQHPRIADFLPLPARFERVGL